MLIDKTKGRGIVFILCSHETKLDDRWNSFERERPEAGLISLLVR